MIDSRTINSSVLIIVIGLMGVLCKNISAQDTSPVANQAVNISKSSSTNNSIESQIIRIPDRYKNKEKSSSDNKTTFGSGSIFTSTTIALVFVILIIIVLAWILRKAWPGGTMLFGTLPIVNILGRANLSPKQSLVAIKISNRLILLGVTEHHISTIATIDEAEEVSKLVSYIEQNRTSSISSTFRNLFKSEAENLHSSPDEPHRDDLEKTSDKIEENDVLSLKNEINMLLNKVEKLKGIGSRD